MAQTAPMEPPRMSISDVLDYGDPKFRRFESWIRRTFGDDAGFNLISAFARVVTTSSFSQISVRGLYRVPTDDALVVCVAPHNNQFVDPLMCFATMPRPISFVAARVSCDAFWLGRFSLLARAIPVRRAQDYRKSGKGVVFQPDPANPTLIRGIDTAFTELQIRGGIVLPGGTVLEITKIISDTECEVKSAPSPAAAALLTPENPSSYKTQPYENQENVYSTVHAVLQQKGAIGIFAEGGSHDRTSLLPFKAGVAVMSLGAMAANPGLNVKILPVGLNYFAPHKWRSTASVSYGEPILIPTEMVEEYKAGGERKRKAVAELLQQITDAIKSQTINAPNLDSLLAIQTVRRLVIPINAALTVHQKLDITRRIISYYLAHAETPGMKKIVASCKEYNEELLALNIRDHQVMKQPVGLFSTLWLLAERLGQLVVGAALAIPGVPLNLPILGLAESISKQKALEAKKASSVKLEGKDVMTSWKLLVILGVTPLWYGAWVGAIDWWLVAKRKWSIAKTLLASPAIYAGMWGIGFSNIWFLDNVARTFKSTRAIFQSIFNPNRTQALRKKRADLVVEINEWLDSLPAEDQEAITSGAEGAVITKEDRAYNVYQTGRLAQGRRPSLDMNAFQLRADHEATYAKVARPDEELFEVNVEEASDEDDELEDATVAEVIRRGSFMPGRATPTPGVTPGQSSSSLSP